VREPAADRRMMMRGDVLATAAILFIVAILLWSMP
jgi:hypothetical protein